MTKRDPWTDPGAIYIPSDFAPAAPVPPGTRLGNIGEMAEQMEPFHQSLVELTKDPRRLREAAHTLTGQFDPDGWDDEIAADLRRQRDAGAVDGLA